MRSWFFFFSSRRRHTRWNCDWSSDVCSSDLEFTIRGTHFTYHLLGHFMDATLFALLKIPSLRRRFWESNPYYRETRSRSTGPASPLASIMRVANAIAYYESRALRHHRFAAAGLLFTATAD